MHEQIHTNREGGMEKIEVLAYEEPEVYTLGTMLELTRQGDPPDKCGGTSDAALPQQLSPRFGTPHCG
jgi:hypothetical protein